MWRYLRWALLALVVVIAIVVALPFMLPTGVYKEQIMSQARQATGRELKIDGSMSVSFFPSFGVELNGVHFANAVGAHDADMATIEQVVVGAEFWPLLSGNVKVTQITLIKPVINLEIDKNGRGNWVFGDTPKADGGDAAPQSPNASGDLSFQDVSIRGGTLTYRDGRTGAIQAVENIDVTVDLPSLDAPMTVAGVLTWNKEALNVTGEVRKPRALADGKASELSAKIVAPVMNASFDGSIVDGGTISGKAELKATSAQRLAAWFNVTLPKVQGFGALELSGEVRASPRQITFSNAKVALDDVHGSGNLTLDTTKARAFVSGDFNLDRLDVNRYSNKKTGRAAGRRSGWSDSPNDFSALNLVDAKLALSVGSAAWSDMKIGRSQIDLDLKNGVALATFKQLQLYGGGGTGTAIIDASKTVPEMKVDTTLSGINASAFLWDLADLTIVSGTASFVLRLNAQGGSERARMQTVSGVGQMQFTNGAVRGVDLEQIARNITSAVVGNALGPKASTPFSSLSGTFLARNGQAVNRNLTLLNPRVRLDGAGVVNVGGRTLNYRVEPKALSGGRRMPNLGVPVHIYGSWDNPKYEPEVGGVVNAAINTVLNAPGDTVETVGDTVGGLLPSIGGGDKGKKKKKKKNPLDELGDFLGGN